MKKKVVIIGGGLGGMAAALRLALRGYAVTLCERNERLGGKMNIWETGGFTFDTGPSLITMPWIFEDLFAAAGARMQDHLELIQVKPLAHYVYPDGTTFDYTTDLPAWMRTLNELEPGGEDRFFDFMTLGSRIYELSKGTFLRHYPTTPPDREAIRALRHFPLRKAWGNYHSAVCHHFKSPHLRQLFDRYPTYVGSSPYLCPATFTIIPYIEYAYAGWYVMGGLYRIIDVLVPLLESAGVMIRAGATVTGIAASGGKVTAVELDDGSRLDADVVVMNGEASRARALLRGAPSPGLAVEDRSLSGVVWLVALRRSLPEYHHHSVYFSADYETEFAQLFDEKRFPDDPTVYVNIPSRTDRTRVPGEGETLFLMANAPATGEHGWDDAALGAIRTAMRERLVRSGFPEMDGNIVAERMYTPRTFSERYLMPGGAIYGQHSHTWRQAFFRPPNKDRQVSGLYYVGGSTHPGGGTPMVLLSAKITSELIEKHESH